MSAQPSGGPGEPYCRCENDPLDFLRAGGFPNAEEVEDEGPLARLVPGLPWNRVLDEWGPGSLLPLQPVGGGGVVSAPLIPPDILVRVRDCVICGAPGLIGDADLRPLTERQAERRLRAGRFVSIMPLRITPGTVRRGAWECG